MSASRYVGVSTTEMRNLGSYWVKGGSINSKLAYVRDRFGARAEEELKAVLTEEGAPLVLEASWYPFALYNQVLHWLSTRHFGGDFTKLRDVGRFSARESLGTIYAVFVRPGQFRGFLERGAAFHSRYYSTGTLKLETADNDGRHFRLVQEGAPIYTEPDLEIACGFYCEAAAMMGLTGLTCRYEYTDNGVAFELNAPRPH